MHMSGKTNTAHLGQIIIKIHTLFLLYILIFTGECLFILGWSSTTMFYPNERCILCYHQKAFLLKLTSYNSELLRSRQSRINCVTQHAIYAVVSRLFAPT